MVNSAIKVQRFFRRRRNLKRFQLTALGVILRIRTTLKFLQRKARVLIAKRAVLAERIKICDNSRDNREELITLFRRSLLSSYCWAPGGYGHELSEISIPENFSFEEAEYNIPRNFLMERDSILNAERSLPQPPSNFEVHSSSPHLQFASEPPKLYFVPVTDGNPDPTESNSLYRRPVTSNHWAGRLFETLELPKSSFLDKIDVSSSQHVLIACSEDEENFSEDLQESTESVSGQIRRWNNAIICNEVCNSFKPCFGDVSRGPVDYTTNLLKYSTGSESDTEHIPELFRRFLPENR